MPPVVVPFVVEVNWNGTYAGRPWSNVMHLVWDLPGQSNRSVEIPAVALAMEAAWGANIRPEVSDQCALSEVVIRDLNSEDGAIFTLGSSLVGQATDAPFPGSVAVLVTKVSEHVRGQRPGRWYQVGAQEVESTAATPNSLSAAALVTYQGVFQGFLGDLAGVAGQDYYPVVLHRSTLVSSGFIPTAVTQLVVQSRLATQRRRLRG